MAKTPRRAKTAKKEPSEGKEPAAAGRPLVIVESPAKARTIGKFLGSGYMIEASVGHVRDLPSNASEIPASVKDEPWSRLGIDIENDFRPLYVVPREKREQMKKLKGLLAKANLLYLATDEDREGESISWHLVQELHPKVEVRRLVFHEITREAIQAALASPRDIDEALVEAQETRRVLDRLYGYSVSPLLWRKIRPRLSAGRVQSVAVRLVVERETERIRFRSAAYWDAVGAFGGAGTAGSDAGFDATLTSVAGRRIATGRDFDPDTGALRPPSAEAAPDAKPVLHLTETTARALVARLAGKPARVASVEKKPYSEKPAAPFTTSTLQQEAGRRLRFAAQRTMRAAQRLYENGHLTYMRTDSTTLSREALAAARTAVETEFGAANLLDAPRTYATRVKNAQEAHEAIRPAGSSFTHPRDLPADVGEDERRVYELVWRRTVASQMPDTRGHRTAVEIAVDDATFSASGKTVEQPGHRLAYVEDGAEDVDAAARETDRVLPPLTVGATVPVRGLEATGHETQPPPRLTEAGLIKELEARGIGRPSTYASIIETILARDYVFKRGTALVPTFTAFAVVRLLDLHLHDLVDYAFTARMEDELDEISNGEKSRVEYLRRFYTGNGRAGLRAQIERANETVEPQEVCCVRTLESPTGKIEVRVGRYGAYLLRGKDERASLPEDLPPDELTLEMALDLFAKGAHAQQPLGNDEATGLAVFVKVGRFGPYVQLGTAEDAGKKGKPKMASLLPGMAVETLSLADAVALLRLPRDVGRATPPAGEAEVPVLAANGRYGPYLKWGTETRSIPAEESPLTISLARALELFAQPKAARRGGRGAPKVLKDLGVHPTSGAAMRVLDGRYGAYVTDGTVNATVPKGESPDAVTVERAVELLAARAAKGPPKRRPRRRSS